jgi:prephenate dehydrogenase
MTVGIAGLGLIGGSFAKSYKKRSNTTVYGFDANSSVEEFAKIYGAVDGILNENSIPKCDLILIALYPHVAMEYLKSIAPLVKKNSVVIDCCGIKREICDVGFNLAEKYGFTYAGGHPMAGTHHSGFRASSEDLFVGECMVIVPRVYDDIMLLDRIKHLLEPAAFGSISVTTAEKHDEIIAFTSQMAHIVSNAFIKSPTAMEHKGFSAGSYKDLTRVAWLNPSMWAELFIANKDNVLKELDTLTASLGKYRDAIANDDIIGLQKLLEEGKKLKEKVDG